MANKRLKASAAAYSPQSKDEAAADVRRIGDLQRDLVRLEAAMNDAIAEITARSQPEVEALREQLRTAQAGVQTWCEAHRDELTDAGKVKSANLVTGLVGWRTRPPSVRLTRVDAVLKTLKVIGLGRFIRTREEVDKDAVLAAVSAARQISQADAARDEDKAALLTEAVALDGVLGLDVVSGVEDFFIEPFEQEAAP